MLNLDYRSVVKLGSVNHHFQDLTITLTNREMTNAILRLETDDPNEFLKNYRLYPCYHCIHILQAQIFYGILECCVPSDDDLFAIGGDWAHHQVCVKCCNFCNPGDGSEVSLCLDHGWIERPDGSELLRWNSRTLNKTSNADDAVIAR